MYVHIGEKFKSLEWFKTKVEESYVEGQENLVFMTDYAIQPNQLMIQFYNWLQVKGCKFTWIDHHITAIQNLKHLNIPGFQNTTKSGCMNTWYELMKTPTGIQDPPMCLNMASDYDAWNKNSEYSWDKQLYPLNYFITSLGIELNDNQGELVQTCKKMFEDNNFTTQCIGIGKYIFKYVLAEYSLANRKIYNCTWNDYNCLILNTSFKGSTQFEQHPDYDKVDICIGWSFDGKRFQYGLYTTKSYINVGDIAQQFLNGGGHKGAAGGETKEFALPLPVNFK